MSPILYKGLCLRIIITEFLQKFSAEFEKDGLYLGCMWMEVYVNCLILIYTREQFEIEEDTAFWKALAK